MKITQGVFLKRNANTVSLTVNLNCNQGIFITKWLDENRLLSNVIKELVLEDEFNPFNMSQYITSVRGSNCKFGKYVFAKMRDQLQKALSQKSQFQGGQNAKR